MLGTIRKSTICGVAFSLAGLVLVFLFFVLPHRAAPYHREKLAAMRAVVSELQLTDLCLFTEARYTRHLSQADLYAAFQDYPMAFDHFPSGSMVLPPMHLLDAADEKAPPRSQESDAARERSP